MKQIKKLVIFFLLILMSTQGLFAQNSQQIEEFISYFRDNAQSLDPIEGLYDFDITYNIWSNYAGKETFTQHLKCVIRFLSQENGEKVFFIRSCSKELEGLVGDICKLGDSGYYIFNRFDQQGKSHKTNFKMRDLFSFFIKEVPITNNSASMQVSLTAAKIFPTKDVYTEIDSKQDIKEWSGTGFALQNGYIVTNYHVIENAKTIFVQGVNSDFQEKYNVKVIATDEYNDLALLQISDNRFNGFGTIPYNVKTSVSDVGEEVFVLGYPLTSTMGDEIKLTTGVISSKTGFQGNVSLYQISAPIQPGNSGGPLFDNKGNLIGIVNAKHKGAENVGYAIITSYLKNLIESSISTSILPNNNQIAELPLTEKVKSLKNYVFMITCSNIGSNSTYYPSNSTSIIKTIEYPTVSRTTAKTEKIKSVKLAKDYTAIEITSNNQSGNSYYQWYNIDRNTYILVNGIRYTLTRTDGIEIAPKKTYFSYVGQDVTFTLYFPPISDTATSIDLIESVDSEWKFYGIKIR